MPQFERRLYEPSDEVRAYDGGEDDYADEGSRLPLLIVIALVVLASFAGVVWLAYTQGVQRGREDGPRIAAAEPVQKPVEQKNPYSGLQIYQPPKPEAENETAAPPPPVAPASRPVAAPVPRAATAAENTTVARTAPATRPAMVAPKPATVPAKAATAPPQTITALIESQQKKAQATLPTKPIAAPAKTTPSPAQTAATSAVPAQQSGGFVLQIGSYPSEAEANASWQTYKSAHPAVAGYAPDVQKAELGAKGTWYRLRVGPFGSLAEASAACAKVKAQGGSCFPAKR